LSTIDYVLIVGLVHTLEATYTKLYTKASTLGLFAHHVIDVPMNTERASA